MPSIEFLKPYDSTDPGIDGVSVTFRFRLIEEPLPTPSEHEVTVSISGTLLSMWGFDRASRRASPELTRTLFAFARQHVKAQLDQGALPQHLKVPLRTDTAPRRNPFDTATLPDPEGFTETFERPAPSSALEAVVADDGSVTIRGLPFQPGERLDIVVRPHRSAPLRDERPPQRAPVTRFDDPFGSVAEDDWEALK